MRVFAFFHAPLKRRALSLFVVVLLAGCAARQAGPLRAGRDAFPTPGGFNQFSPEQEVQIGKQAAAEADAGGDDEAGAAEVLEAGAEAEADLEEVAAVAGAHAARVVLRGEVCLQSLWTPLTGVFVPGAGG